MACSSLCLSAYHCWGIVSRYRDAVCASSLRMAFSCASSFFMMLVSCLATTAFAGCIVVPLWIVAPSADASGARSAILPLLVVVVATLALEFVALFAWYFVHMVNHAGVAVRHFAQIGVVAGFRLLLIFGDFLGAVVTALHLACDVGDDGIGVFASHRRDG